MHNTLQIYQMNFIQFVERCSKPEFIFDLLLQSNTIKRHDDLLWECEECNEGHLVIKKNSRKPLGRMYRCSNKACSKQISILKDTIFEGCKDLKKLMYIIASFCACKKIVDVARDAGVMEETVSKWYKKCREICQMKIKDSNIKLGGENVEVEIDESHLFTNKYHRGAVLTSQSIWVFGIIERISKKIFIQVVSKRDAETLNGVAEARILPGTIVFSDSWRGYKTIKTRHVFFQVNHSKTFVDKEDRNIHTNNIERLWRSLKDSIRGCNIQNYQEHIDLFMYRRYFFNDNLIQNIITLLKDISYYQ